MNMTRHAHLEGLPLPIEEELQGYEALYEVLELLLGFLHGHPLPDPAQQAGRDILKYGLLAINLCAVLQQ